MSHRFLIETRPHRRSASGGWSARPATVALAPERPQGVAIAPTSGPIEREADQAAARVLARAAPEPPSDGAAPPTAPGHGGGRGPPDPASPSPESLGVNASAGRPLDEGTRVFFEPRFGFDFSRVRVHADREATASARALGARAYTTGHHIVFHGGEYAPQRPSGQALLAHELAHVVQQSSAPSPVVRLKAANQIARSPLDLARLDQELAAGSPLTQSDGEIGFGATAGKMNDPPVTDSSLPISAFVFRRTPARSAPAPGGGTTPTQGSGTNPPAPAPTGSSGADAGVPDAGIPDADIRDAYEPRPGGVPEPPDAGAPDAPGPGPSAPPTAPAAPAAPPRALIVGGVHGDERGPLQLASQLQTELASSGAPLRRDFDTIFIPVMNPGGVTDSTRENRRGVDLNRNFPGLAGFPAPAAGTVPPRQPEVQAVMDVVQQLHPSRILALHAIAGADKGGVYADPVEGEARELAARMALRMRGGALGSGGATSDANVRGNQIQHGAFSARYPNTSAVSVTSQNSSLGAWASAPTAAGGQATPVITHEVANKPPLATTGASRSVATIMPGLREFLVDAGKAASEADALLAGAVSDAFLTGEGITAADRDLLASVEGIVRERFQDMNAFYRSVWRPANVGANPKLPPRLTMTQTRDFRRQAGIMAGQLSGLDASSTDAAVLAAIQAAMQTRSMPGFSRHHWGTDIDILSATRTDWIGTGTLVPMIPFLQSEAQRFGFFHPYASAGAGSTGFPAPSSPHYLDEPWHMSYAPLANVLQREWARRITGTVLDKLITRTAAAVRGRVPQATMEGVLRGMNLTSFQTNVAPPP